MHTEGWVGGGFGVGVVVCLPAMWVVMSARLCNCAAGAIVQPVALKSNHICADHHHASKDRKHRCR